MSSPSDIERSGPKSTRWERLQLFVLDELPGIGVVLGAIAATASRIVPSLGAVTIPAIVSIVVGVAFRVLRMRYELAAVSKHVDASLGRTQSRIGSDVDRLGDQVGELRQAVVGPDVHRAEKCTRSGFYKHMLSALESAEQTVDLTQLDAHPPAHYGTPAMVAYFNRQRQIIAERPHVQYRRIVAVPTLAKLDWLIGVLEVTADRPNFQISVIDLTGRERLPAPLSLQIFDCRELCLVDPTMGSMLAGDQANMLWVSGRDAAEVFSNYYNDLWRKALPLKEGQLIQFDRLETMLTDLREGEPREREYNSTIAQRLHALAARSTLHAP